MAGPTPGIHWRTRSATWPGGCHWVGVRFYPFHGLVELCARHCCAEGLMPTRRLPPALHFPQRTAAPPKSPLCMHALCHSSHLSSGTSAWTLWDAFHDITPWHTCRWFMLTRGKTRTSFLWTILHLILDLIHLLLDLYRQPGGGGTNTTHTTLHTHTHTHTHTTMPTHTPHLPTHTTRHTSRLALSISVWGAAKPPILFLYLLHTMAHTTPL